jgi:hypothetical protein
MLGIGVPVGTALPVMLLGDETVTVVRGDVARAVSELMGGGEGAKERRRKAREYGERAHRAMEKGGSSYENLRMLIQSFRRSGDRETNNSGLLKEQQEKYFLGS